jgi:hypothetical protein
MRYRRYSFTTTLTPLRTPYSVTFYDSVTKTWLQGQIWSQAPGYQSFWVKSFNGKMYKVKKTYRNGSQHFRANDIYG